MKNKRILEVVICLSFLCLFISVFSPSVRAQSYSFDVDYMRTDIYVEKDGSITIEYWINFTNHYGAHDIDYVDIGFPNQHYDIGSVEADIDGVKLPDSYIDESPYVQYGVEIWLGWDNYIKPGDTKQLHVIGNNPKMVFGDSEDDTIASVEFSPTWFDSDFCAQYDYLEVNIHFPEGMSEAHGDVVTYHYDEFDAHSEDEDGKLVYTWKDTNLPMEQHMYGVSFPKEYVDSDAIEPWTSSPVAIANMVGILALISAICFSIGGVYFIYRYKTYYSKRYYPPTPKSNPGDVAGGILCTGFCGGFFLLMAWAFVGDIIWIFAFFIFTIVGFGILGYVIYKLLDKKLGKLPYMKPNIKIDSVGVNTHLSVVEAAIIQNVPLSKVVFLIIFSLIRTGHLEILEIDPIKFKTIKPKNPKRLRIYQRKFLASIIKEGNRKGIVFDTDLKKLLVDLIKATNSKMKGYKLDDTINYYLGKIQKAWNVVKEMPTEVEWEDIEKRYEWLILDDDFKPKSKRYLRTRYYYHRPYWYHRYYYYNHYYPRYHRKYYSNRSSNTPPTEHLNIHTFSDSIVKSIENISNSIVSDFSSFADKIMGVVSPVKAPSSGGGGGGGRGGGGCACACACAGCACACAGGGR